MTRARWILLGLGILAAGGARPSIAHAQSTLPGNSIGGFFDALGQSHARQVQVGVPFSFYVITNRALENLYAFELAVEVDPRLRVLSRSADPQSDDILPGEDQWAVSFRSRCLPSSDLIVLLTYQLVADAPVSDLSICIGGSTPSSVDPPAPAHIGCPDLTPAIPFVSAYAGCAQVDAAPVPAAAMGFGMLKAHFGRDD